MGKRSKHFREKFLSRRSIEEVQRDANRDMADKMLRQLGAVEELKASNDAAMPKNTKES